MEQINNQTTEHQISSGGENRAILSNSYSDASSTRIPKCARCRNHGMDRELKGHKEKCPYKSCTCRSCLVVVERQKITAARVAHLRQQRRNAMKIGSASFNSSDYNPLTEEEEFVLTRNYEERQNKERSQGKVASDEREPTRRKRHESSWHHTERVRSSDLTSEPTYVVYQETRDRYPHPYAPIGHPMSHRYREPYRRSSPNYDSALAERRYDHYRYMNSKKYRFYDPRHMGRWKSHSSEYTASPEYLPSKVAKARLSDAEKEIGKDLGGALFKPIENMKKEKNEENRSETSGASKIEKEKKGLGVLYAMFPELEADFLKDVLISYDYKIQTAVEYLLRRKNRSERSIYPVYLPIPDSCTYCPVSNHSPPEGSVHPPPHASVYHEQQHGVKRNEVSKKESWDRNDSRMNMEFSRAFKSERPSSAFTTVRRSSSA